MKRNYLGEFEEVVLLTVLALRDNAYGVTIMHEIVARTGRNVRLNQIHTVLHRLLDKGMVLSAMSEPKAERGGRRKRMFTITNAGYEILAEIHQVRESLWGLAPSALKPSVS